MSKREPQDVRLRRKRIQDHAKVLRFLLDTDNLKNSATGRIESPQKLVVFFAGYIAMRRMWEVKTNHGDDLTGDREIDESIEKKKGKKKTREGSIIDRIDKEVAHPVGLETSTLFRISKFKHWGMKFLQACAT